MNMFWNHYGWLLVAIFGCAYVVHQASARCSKTVGCEDCYSWCKSYKHLCKTENLIKASCKKTCDVCSNSTLCNTKGCTQKCHTNADETVATCSCFEGFRLENDGKTCKDIDECAENATICNDDEKILCDNYDGGFACSKCQKKPKELWPYYQRGECCTRDPSSQCGKSTNNGRVVGGENGLPGRWPWGAYIIVKNNLCGGSLISKDWVVSAGHCFKSISDQELDQVTVVLGVYDTINASNIHEQTFKVAELLRHQNYSAFDNDITLLRLNGSAIIGDYVSTVCLPNGETPKEGEKCFATGYGTIQYRGAAAKSLQEVDLPIVNTTTCNTSLAGTYNVNPTTMLCAGYKEGGKDTCQGDSGGPLVCQRCNSCDWYLAGITSFGKGCASPGIYGVYTNVEHFEEWISQKTNIPITKQVCKKPVWNEWGAWSTCTAACGNGTKSRYRTCKNGDHGEPDCIGETVQSVSCNTGICQQAYWSSFDSWSQCSRTCGGGTRSRARECVNGIASQTGCEGPDSEAQICNDVECPVWQQWTDWSACSKTCASGRSTRERTCANGDVGQVGCEGSEKESRVCNTNICPIWGQWSDWSACSSQSVGSNQSSTRQCHNGLVGQVGCEGSSIKQRPCPNWSAWGEFGACSASCGEGTKSRTRSCNVGSGECNGNATDTQTCQAANACVSLGPCDGKKNLLDSVTCANHASLGYCTSYSAYMKINCELKCCQNVYGITNGCSDTIDFSTCYSYRAFCSNEFFKAQCKQTCNAC